MPGLTNYPSTRATGNKFIVAREDAGSEHQLAKKLDLDRLMLLHGPMARDYADLSHIAEGLAFRALKETQSNFRAPFTELLEGTGAVEVIDKNYAQWRVYGKPETRCMVMGDPNDDGIDYLGIGHSIFQIWVDFDFYKKGDVLAPVYNKTVEVVLQNDHPIPYDGGYLYDCVLKDGNPAAYLNREYFTPGSYFLKLGAVQSWETIGQFGSIQIAESFAYLEYRTPLTTMAWEFEVEAEAHRQWGTIAVARCDDAGRPIPEETGITNYLEMKFNAQVKYESDLALIYGRMSDHMIDSITGKQITTSPGLYEWLEYGQRVTYSPEANNLDFFGEMFQALWFDKLQTSEWSVTLLTGMAGIQLFSKWVEERFGDRATLKSHDFYLKKSTPFDTQSGRDGYKFVSPQFTEYALPGFGIIKVSHWSALDDTRNNGVTYPGTMYPASSYEFIAMDSGFGTPNIKKVVRNDNRYRTHAVGYWSPLGAVNQQNPVFKAPDTSVGDAYKLLFRESSGVVVPNPELIVHFRPNVA